MPPLSIDSSSISKTTKSVNEIDSDSADEYNNNLKQNVDIKISDLKEYGRVPCITVDSITGQKVRYLYNIHGSSIVWRNVYLFLMLHTVYVISFYICFANKCWYTWIFSYWYGFAGGLGVTAGAHRLWSHRSYKAKLPLRIFLCFCHSIAGQNDLFEWCRDHRVHHKFSETDADPHNSKRGFFFAHVGWLLTRKHPEVIEKGKSIDCSDLMEDPVIRIQKRFYILFYLCFCFILPTLIPVYLWNESWVNSVIVAGLWRYCTSLHCTWFVNSAAHMFGDRPYNIKIEPRENIFVSFGAFGEGFHNYHHTFPWDYSTSEMGWRLNATKMFIDFMAVLGQAYDLKIVSPEMLTERKKRIIEMSH